MIDKFKGWKHSKVDCSKVKDVINPCKKCGITPEVVVHEYKHGLLRKTRYFEIDCSSGCGGVYCEERFMETTGGINRLIKDWNTLMGAKEGGD